LSLAGLAVSLALALGMMAGGAPGYLAILLAACVALPFLFSTWALLFHRDLQVALARRKEKWNAAEKARMQELEDFMREGSEK
jgi:hypothetical protein